MSDKYDELKKYVNIKKREKEKEKAKEKENEKKANNDVDKDDRPHEVDNKQDKNYKVSCVDSSHFRLRCFNEVRRIPLEPLYVALVDDILCKDLGSDFKSLKLNKNGPYLNY